MSRTCAGRRQDFVTTVLLHALCNAHHLSELKALVEIEKEDWARKMQQLLRRAATPQTSSASAGLLSTRSGRACMHRLNAVTTPSWPKGWPSTRLNCRSCQPPPRENPNAVGRKPRRTGHNLLLRLANRKQDVLRFLNDLVVPFTNNQADRDASMMKVKQKSQALPLHRRRNRLRDHPLIHRHYQKAGLERHPGHRPGTESPGKFSPHRLIRTKLRAEILGSYLPSAVNSLRVLGRSRNESLSGGRPLLMSNCYCHPGRAGGPPMVG
jgi:hypothetical protein